MKIAYWSPVHGQGRTTSNLAITSFLSKKIYNHNTIAIDMNFLNKDMEKMFMGKPSIVVGEDFTEDIGIDAISRNIKVEELSKESIHNCSISLLESGYHILPSTRKLQEESYEGRLLPVIADILYSLDKYYDMIFIDTTNGYENSVTDAILKVSDIIVVNLPQNQLVLKEYNNRNPLKQYKHKVLYCLGSYEKRSMYNKYNISRIYHREFNQKLGVVPYHYSLMDAISKSNLLSYLDGLSESSNHEDTIFLDECIRMTKLIIHKKDLMRR